MRKQMKERTTDELEQVLKEDIGYVIMQTLTAHRLLHETIVPALRKSGIDEGLIQILNNSCLESQLLFLRKLNEFFKRLPDPKKKERPLKQDDLRAEHYSGFKSPGAFLSDQDEDEIHKRVGHITLIEVRHGKKDWNELVTDSLPIAIDRLLQFCCFLRDSYQPLSSSAREGVQFYITTLQSLKGVFNPQPATSLPTGGSRLESPGSEPPGSSQ